MQQIMPMFRDTSNLDPELVMKMQEDCPLACEEEYIDADMSFTLVSEESHQRAWKLWSDLPANRTKEDAVFMELYFKTLNVDVTKFEPYTIYDLLSSIGGTLGLFLGGSIFSLFEFILVTSFFSMSMFTLFVKNAFRVGPRE